MPYQKISITTTAEQASIIEALLNEQGALSIECMDAADEILVPETPEATPLWQALIISGLFDASCDTTQVIARLHLQLNIALTHITHQVIADQNWVAITQQHFPTQCFANKLWVYPQWEQTAIKNQPAMIINPGLAFGTGTHPTTALCLEWLAQQTLDQKTVIDYGCGSGILALAALTLGAEVVKATDHDPQALQATQANLALNPNIEPSHLLCADAAAFDSAPVDIVLANILANPLITLSDRLIGLCKPQGCLVLSGLLEKDIEAVMQAYASACQLITMTQQAEWVCLVLQHHLDK